MKNIISTKIFILLVLFMLLIFNEASYAEENSIPAASTSSEEEANTDQLKKYEGMTKWLIENKNSFDEVIAETSKNTKTKWFINTGDTDNTADTGNTEKDAATTTVETPTDLNLINHTVIKGDTIYSISKKYNVSVENIRLWNSMLSDSTIKIGQMLNIYTTQTALPDNAPIPLVEKTEAPNLNSNENSNENIDKENPEVVPEEKVVLPPIEDKTPPPAPAEVKQVSQKLPEFKYYKVKKGDTLSSIASSHKMSPDDLINLNPEISKSKPLTLDIILKVKSNYASLSETDIKITKDGFLWPIVGRLAIPFGPQSGGTVNEGINILSKKGTPIKATQDGIVTYVGDTLQNFGNIILLQHSDNWVSAYAHVDNIMVAKGQQIKKGDVIARVGTTGNISTPQLHFELRHKVKPMDPLHYLNSYR